METAMTFPRLGVQVTEHKKTFLALMLIPILLVALTACPPFQSIVERANSIIEQASPAVQLIITLLPLFGASAIPAGIAQAIHLWVPQVQGGFALLDSLLTQLKSAADSAKPDLMSQINAQAKVVVDNLNSILPTLRILNPDLQQKITGLVAAIVDAVNMVVNLIAGLQGKKAAARVSYPVRSGAAFKKHFNDVLHAPSGSVMVDAATAQVSLK
ncbi:MAG: hypothetical protein ACRDQZ_10375 [Mycobacteriales bacterium]